MAPINSLLVYHALRRRSLSTPNRLYLRLHSDAPPGGTKQHCRHTSARQFTGHAMPPATPPRPYLHIHHHRHPSTGKRAARTTHMVYRTPHASLAFTRARERSMATPPHLPHTTSNNIGDAHQHDAAIIPLYHGRTRDIASLTAVNHLAAATSPPHLFLFSIPLS